MTAAARSARWRDIPRAAAFTGLAWVVLGFWRGEWLAHTLVGFAVLGLLPLALSLIVEGSYPADASERSREELPFFYRLAVLQLPILLLGGFFVFNGLVGTLPPVMGTGAIGAFSSVVAFYGLQRLIRRGFRPRTELAIDFGCLLLPFGSVWLMASRLGVPLLGFHEPTVLLTAEHFFHAGFGAPVLFGVLGRHLGEGRALRKAHGLATVVVCLAIPLTAIGIATSRAVEVPAALVLAAGMLVGAVCILSVAYAHRKSAPAAAAALGLSGLSLGVSMTFAAVWAVTGSARNAADGSAMSSLDEMLRWHGAVNSFGFLAAGLVGLTMLEMRRGR